MILGRYITLFYGILSGIEATSQAYGGWYDKELSDGF